MALLVVIVGVLQGGKREVVTRFKEDALLIDISAISHPLSNVLLVFPDVVVGGYDGVFQAGEPKSCCT